MNKYEHISNQQIEKTDSELVAMGEQAEPSPQEERPLTGNLQWKALYREISKYARQLKKEK